MIESFRDKDTKRIFESGSSRKCKACARVAVRKLQQLDSVDSLEDLAAPPGNRLEVLKDDRDGQHSIRINDQYRICFCWTGDGIKDIEIVDYH